MKTTIRTSSGLLFDYANPKRDTVRIEDIAHGLSQCCRFGSQTSVFWSVAEHSLLVSSLCPPKYALQGLLHDASEAYMCDLPSPLKRLLPGYKKVEARTMKVIMSRFGLKWPAHDVVHAADKLALAIEGRQFMHSSALYGEVPPEYLDKMLVPLQPIAAKIMFMIKFKELTQ